MRTAKNNNYSIEFKEDAVRRYLDGEGNYAQLARQLGIRDAKRLRTWVSKVRQGESLEDMRGKASGVGKGRPRTKFDSLEEELAHVKAERDYLKKLYHSRFGHEWRVGKSDAFSKS